MASMRQPTMTPNPNPGIALDARDYQIYEVIMSKKELGISKADLKRETNATDYAVKKIIECLVTRKLIKWVTDINSKRKKLLMGMKFKPAKEISGGLWYTDKGELDSDLIDILTDHCLKHIRMSEVATMDSILKSVGKSPVFTAKITDQQIVQIVSAMVLDGQIVEEKSTGSVGKASYRLGNEGPKVGAFSSIPCGACPRIAECSPDGIVSPQSCVYYNRWLGLEF